MRRSAHIHDMTRDGPLCPNLSPSPHIHPNLCRYSALRESTALGAYTMGGSAAALIDTRQQSAVVRELSKLANASNAGNLEVRGFGL